MLSIAMVSIASIALAVVAGRIISSRLWAAFVVGCLVATGLQLYVRWELGYWDKFWPIAAFTSFLHSFVVALAVIFGMQYLIKLRNGKE